MLYLKIILNNMKIFKYIYSKTDYLKNTDYYILLARIPGSTKYFNFCIHFHPLMYVMINNINNCILSKNSNFPNICQNISNLNELITSFFGDILKLLL